MLLSDMCPGDSFRIRKVLIGGEIGKRLADMGLTRGVEGILVRCAMFGDPIQIHIRNYNLSLRRAEAAGVAIELLARAPGNGRRRGPRRGTRRETRWGGDRSPGRHRHGWST